MLIHKHKKNQSPKGNRFLISITVMGSAGPIRFVANEEDLVANVMETALKLYAREGRLPVLGSDLNRFMLYCSVAGIEVLLPWETIGSVGVRNFTLCKNPQNDTAIDNASIPAISRKRSRSWRAWFYKSVNPKISSH